MLPEINLDPKFIACTTPTPPPPILLHVHVNYEYANDNEKDFIKHKDSL